MLCFLGPCENSSLAIVNIKARNRYIERLRLRLLVKKLKEIRLVEIVRVKKRDILAASTSDSVITRATCACVSFGYDTNSIVAFLILF